jgi:hypothetical protein
MWEWGPRVSFFLRHRYLCRAALLVRALYYKAAGKSRTLI